MTSLQEYISINYVNVLHNPYYLLTIDKNKTQGFMNDGLFVDCDPRKTVTEIMRWVFQQLLYNVSGVDVTKPIGIISLLHKFSAMKTTKTMRYNILDDTACCVSAGTQYIGAILTLFKKYKTLNYINIDPIKTWPQAIIYKFFDVIISALQDEYRMYYDILVSQPLYEDIWAMLNEQYKDIMSLIMAECKHAGISASTIMREWDIFAPTSYKSFAQDTYSYENLGFAQPIFGKLTMKVSMYHGNLRRYRSKKISDMMLYCLGHPAITFNASEVIILNQQPVVDRLMFKSIFSNADVGLFMIYLADTHINLDELIDITGNSDGSEEAVVDDDVNSSDLIRSDTGDMYESDDSA